MLYTGGVGIQPLQTLGVHLTTPTPTSRTMSYLLAIATMIGTPANQVGRPDVCAKREHARPGTRTGESMRR